MKVHRALAALDRCFKHSRVDSGQGSVRWARHPDSGPLWAGRAGIGTEGSLEEWRRRDDEA